jgi:hypothetical protein
LRSIDWLRQNSRIYGLWAALDLEWSQHNPWYRALIDTLGKPKRGIEEFRKLIAEELNKKPAAAPAVAMTSSTSSPSEKTTTVHAAVAPKTVEPARVAQPMPESGYTRLILQTLDSLLVDMRNECTARGAKFAVALMPVRAQVSPLIGQERAFGSIDYSQEVASIQQLLAHENIPCLNVEAAAEQLPPQKKESLFYIVHLAPPGHALVANQMVPFVKQLTQ